MKLETGDAVIVILQNPREKIFGIVDEVGGAGVFVRGIDLSYFDEWTAAIRNGETYLPMQDYFFPMWRVERVVRDEGSDELPSMTDQFTQRTGLALSDL